MNTTHYKEPTEQKEKQKDGLLLDAISLRDYFAAKAMQGDVSAGACDNEFPAIARRAYEMADAMLAAREQK